MATRYSIRAAGRYVSVLWNDGYSMFTSDINKAGWFDEEPDEATLERIERIMGEAAEVVKHEQP